MKTFIQFIKSIYISLFPEQHKKKSFSNINSLTWGNIHQQNFENELLLLKYLVDKDSVFIDVGSNIGQYICMAEKVLKHENIYAFEPNPILFNRLKKIFSKVNIFDIAFSDTNSSASFKIPSSNDIEYNARGTLNVNFKEDNETQSQLLVVKSQKMDTFCEEKKIEKINLIKIDVEGHELNVINGALKTIKKHLPILIIEIEQRHHQQNIKEIINYVKEMGYSCFYFDINKKLMEEFTGIFSIEEMQKKENHAINKQYINNFIFIPKANNPAQKVEEINKKIGDEIKNE